MTDIPEDDDLTPEEEEACIHYESEDHARALRLILASMRKDWPAREQILDEIGECPGCLQAVVLHLAAEAATAYVGPPEETPEGEWRIPEEQTESAVEFISEVLADVLDQQ